jgi:hypothetical protein
MCTVPKEEMIDCESWYHLADYHYTHDITDFPSGVVHCDMGSIPDFFEKIQYNKEKYIVISSRCDFGLHYQQQFPPWADYAKLAKQCLGPYNTNNGYENIVLPAPLNSNRCNKDHKYSIKCYRYTEATFNEIPKNIVHWFVANNTILNDARITNIPFGINGTDGNQEPKEKIYNKINSSIMVDGRNIRRKYDLYVNFQFYTNERTKLFELYNREELNQTVERNVSFDVYLQKLSTHNCCLCPSGNGGDCYRTLEALYMGCIPIIEKNEAMIFYNRLNLPIIYRGSLEGITQEYLSNIRELKINDRNTWDLTGISISYWNNKIEHKRQLLR